MYASENTLFPTIQNTNITTNIPSNFQLNSNQLRHDFQLNSNFILRSEYLVLSQYLETLKM